MLGYINILNEQVKAERQDIDKVIRVARIVAWECLKHTCRPTTVKRNDVLKALSNEADAAALLKYLRERLQLIQAAGPISDLVRFSLDPLAEYLAAIYLLERCGKFEDLWSEFFENAEQQSGAPETIKGFLLAVRDCCAEKGTGDDVPMWVKDKLGRLAGLNPEAAKATQLKQRIARLTDDLELPDAEDRRTAAEKLGNIGSAAKEAARALIAALQDIDKGVRRSAASALGGIGPDAKEAVPALIAALKDPDKYVCRSATDALGGIGQEAKEAIPALIAALQGQDADVRSSAVAALGRIGPEAKEVVPALIAALQDSDKYVRRSATAALGGIGPDAKEAAPALIAALKDPDKYVRNSAEDALRDIGP
jgi:vesicle coat complex subunit